MQDFLLVIVLRLHRFFYGVMILTVGVEEEDEKKFEKSVDEKVFEAYEFLKIKMKKNLKKAKDIVQRQEESMFDSMKKFMKEKGFEVKTQNTSFRLSQEQTSDMWVFRHVLVNRNFVIYIQNAFGKLSNFDLGGKFALVEQVERIFSSKLF